MTNTVPRVQLHHSGPVVSGLIWGSMRCESQFATAHDLAEHLRWLLDQGVTTLDTASVYGYPDPFTVEEFLGKALAEVGPEKFEIITKCGIQRLSKHRPENRVRHFDFSEKEIRKSTDLSLQKLGVDCIDTMLLHRPDYLMDPDETAGVLDDLVAAGKIRHVGVSNLSVSRCDLVASRLKAPIVTNQIEFSPLHLDPISDGSFDHALIHGYKPMIWSPVGGGRLLTSQDEKIIKLRAVLEEVAQTYGLDGPAEAAVAFVARHPVGGIPLIGSGNKDRIAGAIKAINIEMDCQDWYSITAATNPSLLM